ncbi:hypothetical protein ACS126_18690 [Sphingobacterium lactis]|uniref:hypothetical protein n=1 Tax=Sphingobacterium lactis TaxID=797291 RepID=UPI003EC519F5
MTTKYESINEKMDVSVAPLPEAALEDLIDQSEEMKKSCVISSVMDNEQLTFFRKSIIDVIRYICINKNAAYGFRVFDNGTKLDHEALVQNVFSQIPRTGDDGSKWISETFEDRNFGIIMNTSEKFSKPLVDLLSISLEPLLMKVGIPSGGFHTTTFIGNYGYTPLGIHKDHPGASVLHLHLGPGKKKMYVWDRKYDEAIKSDRQNLEKHLEYAKEYSFGEGDIFFMPSEHYHIGFTDGYSAALTIWFDSHSKKSLLTKVLSSLESRYEIQGFDNEITQPFFTNKPLSFSNIDRVLSSNQQLSDRPFNDVLWDAFEDFRLALISNRGWTSVPLTVEQETGFEIDSDYLTLKDKCIKVVTPFSILYKVSQERKQIAVYVRGAKIEVNYHSEIIRIINQLNNFKFIEVTYILSQFENSFPVEAGLYFLAMLYNKQGFEAIDRN